MLIATYPNCADYKQYPKIKVQCLGHRLRLFPSLKGFSVETTTTTTTTNFYKKIPHCQYNSLKNVGEREHYKILTFHVNLTLRVTKIESVISCNKQSSLQITNL